MFRRRWSVRSGRGQGCGFVSRAVTSQARLMPGELVSHRTWAHTRPAGLAQRLPRPASQPHCFHQRRPARGQQARSPGAGAGPAAPGGAVLLLPGFLSGASQYEGLAELLRGRGYATEIVPLTLCDWLPVLAGGSFSFYASAIDAATQRLYAQHGRVALVGHSAGGWVARLVLGDQPFEGTVYNKNEMVHTLLTLGTPHHSLEQYPFGRVPERLSGPNLEGVPEAVRGSSLQFANHFYPRGDCFPGVRVACLVGDAIRGRPLFDDGTTQQRPPSGGDSSSSSSSSGAAAWDYALGSASSAWGSMWNGPTGSSGGDGYGTSSMSSGDEWLGGAASPSRWEQYFAWESYKSGCGQGDVDGDGVTPIEIAHLPGAAENLVLPGVWHQPRRGLGEWWYGDPGVVDVWERFLRPEEEAEEEEEEEEEEGPLQAGGGAAGAGFLEEAQR